MLRSSRYVGETKSKLTHDLEFGLCKMLCTHTFATVFPVLCPCAVINPRRACAARVTVVGSVCVCVCLLLDISLLECLFVSQTMRRTQRAMKYERFSLTVAELQPSSIVRLMHSQPFFFAAACQTYLDRAACSVYLEGIKGQNEGRVSTPACYLLL